MPMDGHSPVSLDWWHSLTTLEQAEEREIWVWERLERCSCGEVGALHVGTEGKRTEIVSDPSQANPELGIYKPVVHWKIKGERYMSNIRRSWRGLWDFCSNILRV